MPKANYQFTPSPDGQSFPTTIVATTSAFAAVAGLGLLVYLIRRK